VPVPVAVGTDLFEIVFSGGISSFLYGLEGGVDLSIVAPLLAGSALGARIGSAATGIVDEGDIKIYFGLMLLRWIDRRGLPSGPATTSGSRSSTRSASL